MNQIDNIIAVAEEYRTAELSMFRQALRTAIEQALADAREQEREACAKVCDDQAQDEPYGHAKFRCVNIAAAIRARKDNT